jgi:hypothetical protein
MTLPEVIGAIHPLREAGGISPSEPIGAVTADSRDVGPGSVFIALPGERADGADFIGEAFGKGALAVIVSEAGARKVPDGLAGTKPVFVVRTSHWSESPEVPGRRPRRRCCSVSSRGPAACCAIPETGTT